MCLPCSCDGGLNITAAGACIEGFREEALDRRQQNNTAPVTALHRELREARSAPGWVDDRL